MSKSNLESDLLNELVHQCMASYLEGSQNAIKSIKESIATIENPVITKQNVIDLLDSFSKLVENRITEHKEKAKNAK